MVRNQVLADKRLSGPGLGSDEDVFVFVNRENRVFLERVQFICGFHGKRVYWWPLGRNHCVWCLKIRHLCQYWCFGHWSSLSFRLVIRYTGNDIHASGTVIGHVNPQKPPIKPPTDV